MLRRNQTDMKNTYSKTQVGKLIGAAFAATALVGTGGSLDAAGIEKESDAPKEISASDWRGIRAAYEAGRNAIKELPAGGFAARSAGPGWRTEFDGTGFVTTPRDGSWTWGLELRAIDEERVGTAKSGTADGNRLAFARSAAVFEWFVNRSEGLQQGWTIVTRPEASADWLRLELRVRGDLRPKVGAKSVDFVDSTASVVLTYGGLLAWDADGRKLPVEFAALEDGIAVRVDDRGARYPVTIDPVAQQAYVKASNTDANDSFGFSVAISGDTVVVGAPEEDSTAANVNGDDSNDAGNNEGAAFVFVRNGGAWTQQAYLKASNPGALDNFGHSVAISGDVIVVGAPRENSSTDGVNTVPDELASDAGAAYTFRRSGGGNWAPGSYLKASNSGTADRFGESVAISGNTIVVGAIQEDSGATNIDGATGDGTNEAGAAYVFFYNGFFWLEQAYLKASNTGADDEFGTSVAVQEVPAENAAYVIVGAPFEDQSAMDSGAAYGFIRAGGIWSVVNKLKASNPGPDDEFGHSVAISGTTVVVGAWAEDSPGAGVNGNQGDGENNSGAAYVFELPGLTWEQTTYLKAFLNDDGTGNQFGDAVAIESDLIVVGAPLEDSDSTGVNGSQQNIGAGNSGAAFVYRRAGSTWVAQSYLKASNTGFGDRFGEAVAVSGETAIIGAPEEDSGATGINGNQGLGANASGAGYVFTLTPSPAVDATPPALQVRGRKSIETFRKRVVIRGTTSDASGVKRVEFKAGKGGFKKAKLKGGKRWKAVVRIPANKSRVVAKIRSIDNAGNTSKVSRVRVVKR